jgi:hypothetical protein
MADNAAGGREQDGPAQDAAHLGKIRKFFLSMALAGFVPILTGTAYLVGVEYHRTYLDWLHVPKLLIAKTATDYFLYAHSAFASSLFAMLSSTALLIFSVGMYGSIWRGANQLVLKFEKSERAVQLQARMKGSPRAHLFSDVILLPLLFALLVYFAVIGLLFALVLPAYIGEAAGKLQAEKDLSAFNLGCKKAQGTYRFCSEIREGESVLARGFIIDSSEKYVAVYDEGTTRTFPIEGKYFVATF